MARFTNAALPIWKQYAEYPTLEITWYEYGSTTPVDLTDATITGDIRRGIGGGDVEAITGVLTVTDEAGGVFTWAFSSADVAQAGNFEVDFIATYSSGATPGRTFTALWRIEAALV